MRRLPVRLIAAIAFCTWLVLGALWAVTLIDRPAGGWWQDWPYVQLIAALLFGLVLITVAGGKPPLLPLFLSMMAAYVITSSAWGFIPTGRLIRAGMLDTIGQSEARVGSWAMALALAASAALAIPARARGVWVSLGWWGAVFVWVYGVAWLWPHLLGPSFYEYVRWPLSPPPWPVVWGAAAASGIALGGLTWLMRRPGKSQGHTT